MVDELSRKIDSLMRTIDKYGKYIEELEKDVAILKRDSHPPQEFICCRRCGCKITKIKKN